MRILIWGATTATILGLAGCASTTTGPEADAPAADASLADATGRTRATATLNQTGSAVTVTITATDMAPGTYGAHVHATGRCDAPEFASAGPHWNPERRQHGRENPQGTHKGDLPNLMVGTDGRGSLEYAIAGAQLASGSNRLLDEDGAALVVHAAPDDYRTDPSGNSGARVACGVIG
jgi:superoxide dismutase, Cu-Zn family